jgi:site-specific recombinase XerD
VIIRPGALTPMPDAHLVPALIADAGDAAAWRYIEFFTVNIRNPHTRRAYARACTQFFAWCEDRGLTLTTIRPYDVATYIECLQLTHSAPAVKQQLAAVRMLFNWLITGQVVPANPASAVRGPKHVVKTGVTPVLDAKEWRKLLDAIPTDTVRDLRDRALIATLTYSFARITAALTMKVEDLRPKGAGWQLRLHEKGGKHHVMPCHHNLDEYLVAYLDGACATIQRGHCSARSDAAPASSRGRRYRRERLCHDPSARCGGWYPNQDRQPHHPRHWRHRLPQERRRA